jgi:acetoacetyl-CoA synthetase
VLYDGNPAYPRPDVIWMMAAEAGATVFGASPPYVQIMQQLEVVRRERFDLGRLRSILCAGSPARTA